VISALKMSQWVHLNCLYLSTKVHDVSSQNTIILLLTIVRQDSTVGMATGYELDNQGVGVQDPVGSRIFSSPRNPGRLWGHPVSYPTGTGGLSLGIKRRGHDTDHSPPTSATVKKTWLYTSTPTYVFMA
jgi:hypothetical protein